MQPLRPRRCARGCYVLMHKVPTWLQPLIASLIISPASKPLQHKSLTKRLRPQVKAGLLGQSLTCEPAAAGAAVPLLPERPAAGTPRSRPACMTQHLRSCVLLSALLNSRLTPEIWIWCSSSCPSAWNTAAVSVASHFQPGPMQRCTPWHPGDTICACSGLTLVKLQLLPSCSSKGHLACGAQPGRFHASYRFTAAA